MTKANVHESNFGCIEYVSVGIWICDRLNGWIMGFGDGDGGDMCVCVSMGNFTKSHSFFKGAPNQEKKSSGFGFSLSVFIRKRIS